MVRSLVGLSYDVGRGFTPFDSVAEIIESRDRSRVVTVAPPYGLVLWEVGY
jgi:tRNA U38,U39,U40 pseudouridine synthase TruA